MNIALLDPDYAQAEILKGTLSGAGHECHIFSRAEAFFSWLPSAQCDLLILDSATAEMPLPEILRHLRERSPVRIPALLLVEIPDSETILSLLDAGLDDYCLRSVSQPSDLALRVQVLLRRAWPDRTPSAQLKVGAFVFDMQAMRLTVGGREIRLAQKEFELALLLFQHLGQPLSRATMLDAVWGMGADVDPDFRSVDTHMARVRRKLHLRSGSGFRLASVYGYGYVLEQVNEKAVS